MQEYAVDDINFLAVLILQLKYKIIMPIDSNFPNSHKEIGIVLPRKWSQANRTEIRVIALEGSVINKERLDINILNDIATRAPKSD